jgi:hypothetical protein
MACPCPVKVFHLQKDAEVVGVLLIPIILVLGLHVDLDQLENEATP